ncbi:MAG: hypothetical protein RLZZ599_1382 [Bacteroidota bacterium]
MRQETVHTEPISPLRPTESILGALDQMEELKLSHLPLVDETGRYIGLISEDMLLEATDDQASVSTVLNPAFAPCVRLGSHEFEVLELCTQHRITFIPVIDLEGVFRGGHMLSDVLEFFRGTPALVQPGAVVVLHNDHQQYSMVEIATVVEQNDAKILASWLTHRGASQELQITLKLNVEHTGPIVRSLQRYGYEIDGIFGDQSFQEDYQRRYNHLMNYLKY